MTILILFIVRSLISEFFEILAKQFIIQCTFFSTAIGKKQPLAIILDPDGFGSWVSRIRAREPRGVLAYTVCCCLQVSVSSDLNQTHQENAVFGASFQLEVVFFQDILADQP